MVLKTGMVKLTDSYVNTEIIEEVLRVYHSYSNLIRLGILTKAPTDLVSNGKGH